MTTKHWNVNIWEAVFRGDIRQVFQMATEFASGDNELLSFIGRLEDLTLTRSPVESIAVFNTVLTQLTTQRGDNVDGDSIIESVLSSLETAGVENGGARGAASE